MGKLSLFYFFYNLFLQDFFFKFRVVIPNLFGL